MPTIPPETTTTELVVHVAVALLILALACLVWPTARAHETMQQETGRAPSQGWQEAGR